MPTASVRPSAEDRIRAATWFAERGFGVFSVWSATPAGACRCPKGSACDSPGKHPITPSGFHDATTDPERIRTLLSAGSEPNYGLVCPDGVFALDVDGEGVARLAELEATHGPLPPTLRTRTANGEHVFLRWPDAIPRPIGQLWGFVTRWGSGRNAGYVIGPRSVHASGAVYTPEGTSDIATLPEAWARSLVAPAPAAGTITIAEGAYELPDVVPAAESRYEAIRTYTAHLYNRGLTPREMWPLVRDLLAPRFELPLGEAEVRARFERTTADLGERLGPPRALAEPAPEPVDPSTFPLPEDRGGARLSSYGDVEYVEDLIRPGRIVVWAAQEGSGKSYAVTGELAIRVAVAGGSFAETWPVIRLGPALVLSEMHADDDYAREETVLASLGISRESLRGRYFRLALMTAAGGKPALTVPEWREWVTDWLAQAGALLLVVDTATGATQVKPWGEEIQEVYRALRMMLERYPALAIVLIVHVRKPTSRGERDLSDVLGEWGRWSDVVVLQENEGKSFDRAKLSVRKRVKRERRIVAVKSGGLLRDAIDIASSRDSKVPVDAVVSAIRDHPGATFAELAAVLEVSKDTAKRYVADLGDQVKTAPTGPKRALRVWLDLDGPPHTTAQADAAVIMHENEPTHTTARPDAAQGPDDRRTAAHLRTDVVRRSDSGLSTDAPTAARSAGGAAVGASGVDSLDRRTDLVPQVDAPAEPAESPPPDVVDATPTTPVACADYRAHQTRHVWIIDRFVCPVCHPGEMPA